MRQTEKFFSDGKLKCFNEGHQLRVRLNKEQYFIVILPLEKTI